jgi:hypothetical protein
MALINRLREKIYKGRPWYERPRLSAVNTLIQIRKDLREHNLHDTEDGPLTGDLPPVAADAPEHMARTVAGTYNDLKFPKMGAVDTRFGRNFPIAETRPDMALLMTPSPRVVSKRLMTRDEFQPATILNLLAAAWIQFEVHDWFSHGKVDPANGVHEVPLAEGDDWPEEKMRIPHTEPDGTPSPDAGRRPTFRNHVTQWWDASQIYGSRPTIAAKVRAMADGRLKIDDAKGILLLDDATGLDLTAIVDNWWIGLSLLHTLFTKEHNFIAAELKKRNPGWNDERLFQVARLINVALMAKIHTVEWTPAILPNPLTQVAMRTNWHGLSGEGLQKIIPLLDNSELLGGIVGSKADHHAAPYSLTEEFVAVYRMHPLLRDDLEFVSLGNGEVVKHELPAVAGKATRAVTEGVPMADLFYSFGLMHPGALSLHNYPRHLQLLKKDDGTYFDMASVDILRDRERGVPRYNRFREMLRKPRVESFEQMTSNPAWAKELAEVYGNVDQVDLMTGLYAEPLPPGFGFSETAFRVFVLMASRRLKSDRFFTDDYRAEFYTDFGLEHIKDNSMLSVLKRHHPELAPALEGVTNAFQPWKKVK